jgi:hypothetical protein
LGAQHLHRHLDQVFKDRLVRPEVELLKHHAQRLAQAFDLAPVRWRAVRAHPHRFTTNDDLPRTGRFQKVDAAQHGRLARPGPADDGDHVPFMGGQRNPLENLKRPKGFVQIRDADRLGPVLNGTARLADIETPSNLPLKLDARIAIMQVYN